MQSIQSRGLSALSLLKLLIIGLFIPLLILGLAYGIAAFFGASTVKFNEVYMYGWKGLALGPIIGGVLGAVFSVLLWLVMYCALWIYTRFCTIELTIKN